MMNSSKGNSKSVTIKGVEDPMSPSSENQAKNNQSEIYSTVHIGIHIVLGALTYFAALSYVCITQNDESFFSVPTETFQKSSNSTQFLNRLLYTLRLQVYPVEVLQMFILAVIYVRLANFTARNPLSGHEFLVEKANRILGNTIEQMLYFELTIFIFAVSIEAKYLFLVPFSTAVFVLGRIAFAIGYYFHPKFRVVGFVWTMLPVFLLQAVNFFKFHKIDLLELLEKVTL